MSLDSLPLGNHVWIPILIFISIIVISGVIAGFLGWKSSLYFLGGNILFGIIGILIYVPIYNKVIGDLIKKYGSVDSNITSIIEESRGYWGSIFLISDLLIANIILGVAYIFLYKYLKIEDDSSTTTGKIGKILASGSLGVVTGVLIATPAMNTATAFFSPINIDGSDIKRNKLESFSNWWLKTISFHYIYETRNLQRLGILLKMLRTQHSALYTLSSLLSPQDNDKSPNDYTREIASWNAGHNKLRLLFGDPELTRAMMKSIPKFSDSKSITEEFYNKYFLDFLNNTLSKFAPLNLDKKVQNISRSLFNNMFVVVNPDKSIDKAATNVIIDKYVSHIFGDGTEQSIDLH